MKSTLFYSRQADLWHAAAEGIGPHLPGEDLHSKVGNLSRHSQPGKNLPDNQTWIYSVTGGRNAQNIKKEVEIANQIEGALKHLRSS